jgi:hypothetical protein
VPPYRRAAIGFFGKGTQRIAGLEGEVLLDGMDGREVVVFDLTKLQEAIQYDR